MKDFVFSNTTKVYFGKDQLHHLSEEIAKFGKKVLLVYGGGSIKKIGLYDKVIAELKKADMTVFELGGVEPNPHHTTVNKGAALCKKEGIDVLLAVGGGSTIDATKAMAATAKYEGDDCWDIITGKAFVPDNLPIGFRNGHRRCYQQRGTERKAAYFRTDIKTKCFLPRSYKYIQRQRIPDRKRKCGYYGARF